MSLAEAPGFAAAGPVDRQDERVLGVLERGRESRRAAPLCDWSCAAGRRSTPLARPPALAARRTGYDFGWVMGVVVHHPDALRGRPFVSNRRRGPSNDRSAAREAQQPHPDTESATANAAATFRALCSPDEWRLDRPATALASVEREARAATGVGGVLRNAPVGALGSNP